LSKGKPYSLNRMFIKNRDARVRNMRYEDELAIPKYVKIIAHESFVYLASKEYNDINRYIKEKKLSTNNYIVNVIKYYSK